MYDERLFTVKDYDFYKAHVLLPGSMRARDLSVAVVGLARDIEPFFETTKEHIMATVALFKSFHVYVLENDSRDGTAVMLDEWAKKDSRIHILHEQHGNKKYKSVRSVERGRYMSRLRNHARGMINWMPDVVIVADMDLPGGWSINGIRDTMSYWGLFDAMTANGLIVDRDKFRYFDAWALRTGTLKPMTADEAYFDIQVVPGDQVRPVLSAFGGLTVYRADAYLHAGVRYNEQIEDVDHVGMYQSMLNCGFSRIYINPAMVALYSRVIIEEEKPPEAAPAPPAPPALPPFEPAQEIRLEDLAPEGVPVDQWLSEIDTDAILNQPSNPTDGDKNP